MNKQIEVLTESISESLFDVISGIGTLVPVYPKVHICLDRAPAMRRIWWYSNFPYDPKAPCHQDSSVICLFYFFSA